MSWQRGRRVHVEVPPLSFVSEACTRRGECRRLSNLTTRVPNVPQDGGPCLGSGSLCCPLRGAGVPSPWASAGRGPAAQTSRGTSALLIRSSGPARTAAPTFPRLPFHTGLPPATSLPCVVSSGPAPLEKVAHQASPLHLGCRPHWALSSLPGSLLPVLAPTEGKALTGKRSGPLSGRFQVGEMVLVKANSGA